MLASILRTSVAEEFIIRIMDAFVSMRHYLNDNKDIYKSLNIINNKLVEHDEKFDIIFSSFKEKNNYLDKNLLDLLSKTNKHIKAITNKYNNSDYEKYIEQYHNIELIVNNSFHDRFIIIDRNVLYHCGAGFKDLGVKCFAINKIDEKDFINRLINKL